MTAKKYNEKPTADWNANDFLAYIADRHLAVYGTEYTPPGRNWQVERGLIGNLIGTTGRNPKPRKYEPAIMRAFIDECLRNHRCTPQWPTVTFTWFWKWKTDIWARVLAEQARQQRKQVQEERSQQAEEDIDDTIGWL
jgi:hypothetical protein